MEGPYDPRRWAYEAPPSAREARKRANPKVSQPQPERQTARQDQNRALSGTRQGDHPRAAGLSVPPRVHKRPRAPAAPVHRADGGRSGGLVTLSGRAVISGIFLAFLLGGICWLSWSSRPTVDDIPPVVKAHIDRVVGRTVNRAFRDPVGRRDFALLADGGILLPELTEVTFNRNFLQRRERGHRPEAALDDDLHIGNCWSIPGTAGQLGFRLSAMIHPTHVSIDHIPLEIAADISLAPREIALWGGIDGPYRAIAHNLTQSHGVTLPTIRGRSGPPNTHGYDFALLAHVEYDIRASAHVQTFPLHEFIVDSELVFGVVVLEILSNWGGESTCLYRVRVHGEVADVL